MIITIGNTKGGVGKTTLALSLAVLRAHAGRDVWAVDADAQGTLSSAIEARSAAGVQPALACSSYPNGQQLREQVRTQAGKYQDVVIDVGGRDSSALRAALVLTDVLLIPFQPRSFDVWALTDIAALVAEARAVRDGLRAVAVLSMADPAGQDNGQAAAAVAGIEGIEYLPTSIGRRKAFADAAGQGRLVSEMRAPDAKAVVEIQALSDALFSH